MDSCSAKTKFSLSVPPKWGCTMAEWWSTADVAGGAQPEGGWLQAEGQQSSWTSHLPHPGVLDWTPGTELPISSNKSAAQGTNIATGYWGRKTEENFAFWPNLTKCKQLCLNSTDPFPKPLTWSDPKYHFCPSHEQWMMPGLEVGQQTQLWCGSQRAAHPKVKSVLTGTQRSSTSLVPSNPRHSMIPGFPSVIPGCTSRWLHAGGKSCPAAAELS